MSKKETIISLRLSGMKISDIADNVGLKPATVKWHLLGVHKPKPEVSTKELIKALVKDGFSPAEIAEKLGISRRTVYSYTPDIVIPVRKNPMKDRVLEMRRSGLGISEIMSRLGISKQSIVNYSKGHRFKRSRGVSVGRPKGSKKKVDKTKKEEKPLALRADRNEGRSVTVVYQGLGSKQSVDILVRDPSISAEEAGIRWCKRSKKEFINSY